MAFQQVTAAEFFSKLDPSVWTAVKDQLRKFPTATHFALFENLDFTSSQLGRRTCIVVGPNNTFKSPQDCVGRWLNDLPSQRQYPVAWVTVGDVRNSPHVTPPPEPQPPARPQSRVGRHPAEPKEPARILAEKFRNNAGAVVSRVSKHPRLPGHFVVYNARKAGIDADHPWVAMYESLVPDHPHQSGMISFPTRDSALYACKIAASGSDEFDFGQNSTPDALSGLDPIETPKDRCTCCPNCVQVARTRRALLQSFARAQQTGQTLGDDAANIWNSTLRDYPCTTHVKSENVA